jgi:hypothetical protein
MGRYERRDSSPLGFFQKTVIRDKKSGRSGEGTGYGWESRKTVRERAWKDLNRRRTEKKN